MAISRAVVISLTDSTRRQGFQDSDWGDLAFEVFDAIDTRSGFMPRGFNEPDFRRRYGREPRGGEIGCVMSHYEVIRYFAHETGNAEDLLLVAEDDARPVPEFKDVLDEVVRQWDNCDVAILAEPIFGSLKSMKFYAVSFAARRVGHGRRFGHYVDRVAGTGLYLISRQACRQYVSVVERSGGVSWVADDYVTFPQVEGMQNPFRDMSISVVRPGIADWEGETTIQESTDYERYRQRKLREYGAGERSLVAYLSRLRRRLDGETVEALARLASVTVRDFLQQIRRG